MEASGPLMSPSNVMGSDSSHNMLLIICRLEGILGKAPSVPLPRPLAGCLARHWRVGTPLLNFALGKNCHFSKSSQPESQNWQCFSAVPALLVAPPSHSLDSLSLSVGQGSWQPAMEANYLCLVPQLAFPVATHPSTPFPSMPGLAHGQTQL